MFVDAHLHAWDRTKLRYPWLEDGEPDAPLVFEPSELVVDGAPAAAVFVEAAAHRDDSLHETRWAASLGRPVLAAVSFAPVELGDSVRAHLDAICGIPLVTGVRQVLQGHPNAMIEGDPVVAGVRAVGTYGFTFDACVRDFQLSALLHLARAAPNTMIVLDHLGKPPVRSGWDSARAADWRSAIQVLAKEPNVCVKVSGMPPESAPGPLDVQARPFVDAALDAFGVRRAMAGSDWPVSRLPNRSERYSDWFRFLAFDLGLSIAEREDLLVSTAARVYRIPRPIGERG